MGGKTQNREANIINSALAPRTHAALLSGLRDMGVTAGDLLLVHTSLSKLGWVCGGEQTVLEVLLEAVGPTGTLVMPGFSSQLSDPTNWSSPPVPVGWVQPILDNMPLFDPHRTPTRGIGRVAELFRQLPDTLRSDHPVDSFLAHGPLAQTIVGNHPLANALGQKSPLGKLYSHDAKVLLLGSGYGSCTSFHLAEDGLPGLPLETVHYPTRRENGVTQWTSTQQPPSFEQVFPEIGAAFEIGSKSVTFGFDKTARLFPMASAVDFAKSWFSKTDLTIL